MGKYKNLKEFINSNWYDLIFDGCLNYLKNNIEHYDISSMKIPNPERVWLESVEIKSLYSKLKNPKVDIHITVCTFVFFSVKPIENVEREFFEDYVSIDLKMVIEANFDDGFISPKIKKIESNKNAEEFNNKNASTGDFIPYMDKKGLDNYAEMFLKSIYPEALEMPMPIDTKKVLQSLGLHFSVKTLPDGIFGQLYYFDNEQDNIKGGTILLDVDKGKKRGLGNVQNTIIHECVHWFFHKRYFDFMRILGDDIISISCSTSERERKNFTINPQDYYWMEWQANSLAPRILMPAKTFLEKFNEIYQKNSISLEENEVFALDISIDEVANFFRVSKISAKLRLLELGVDKVAGIHEYIDGIKVYAHKTRSYKMEKYETFSINFKDVVNIAYSNKKIFSLITNNKIIYVDNFLVINNPKYVKKDFFGIKTLTDYALNNMEECCFIFRVKTKNKNDEFNLAAYSLFSISKRQRVSKYEKELSESNKYNKELYISASLAEKVEDYIEAEEFANIHRYDNFNELYLALEEHAVLSNKSDAEIARITGLDAKTISNYRLGKTNRPSSINHVLAIAAAFHLEPPITFLLLERADHNLGSLPQELQCAYKILINSSYECGLDYWNYELKPFGEMAQLP